jgi:hypothetical protein
VKALPEMLFSSSRVTLLHEPSGVALDFTALGALRGWLQEGLPPLQVKVAQVCSFAVPHSSGWRHHWCPAAFCGAQLGVLAVTRFDFTAKLVCNDFY